MKNALALLAADEARSLRVAGELAREGKSLVGKSGGSTPGWLFNRPDLDVGGSGGGEKLTRPYANSVWIQRAIQLKAGEIAAVPLKFYEGDREFSTPEFDAFWRAPFVAADRRRIGMADAYLQLAGWIDMRGEFFILLGDEWLVPFPELKGGKLPPLVIARPDRMQPIMRDGEHLGWMFTDGAGRRWPLLPEQVERYATWNPDDDTKPLAPVQAVMLAAETEYLAGLYARNLMRANGDQGVYVISKTTIDDPQQEQIVAQLRAKRAARQRGEFRPVFLSGGDITIEDAKTQALDANANAGRVLDRHTIFIGLGVPASMADVQASYSIGSDSDRARLVTGTCQALAKLINEALGRIASRMMGRTLTAESDWDEHPVLQEVRRQRLASAKDLFDRGIAWREINDILDLGLQPFPGWEIAYMPFSFAPVSLMSGNNERTDPVQDPALAEPESAPDPVDDDPEMRQIKLALAARRRARSQPTVRRVTDPFGMFACDCGGEKAIAQRARSEREIAQWRELMAARRGTMKSFESAFGRVLMAARQETLRKIEAAGAKALGAAPVQRAAAVDFIFNLADFAGNFFGAMERQQRTALDVAGKQLFAELGKDDPFAYPPGEALDYLGRRQNKLADVPADIWEQIRASLQEGLNAGDSTAELAKRVRSTFNAIDAERARRIALTETSAAYGAGREAAMRSAGVRYKRWLTSGNDNVRPSHAAANGQTGPGDQPCIVDGEARMHPGDDAGSPGNVINCHCVSIAVAGEDAS